MPDEKDLEAVFAEMDALGIAPLKAEKPRMVATPDSRLRDSFREITAFVEANRREPQKGTNMKERALAMRLAEFRENPAKAQAVLDIDPCNLLPHENASMEDVLTSISSPSFEEDIFDTSNLPARRKTQGYRATRIPCKNFDDYKPLLLQCQEELLHGQRHIVRVPGHGKVIHDFGVGRFVVVRGILGYVAGEDEETVTKGGPKNKRLRVVYDNGTESDILLRSLFAAMYENGFLVSELDDESMGELMLGEDDIKTGLIYVLKSKSTNPEIQKIPNLYKIGVSTQAIEDRIANAEHEPTYLMDKVEIIECFPCYNLNVQKMETLIHHVFADAQMLIEVVNDKGRVCRPHEWFSIPISIIHQAIEMIKDGSIVNYRYDKTKQRMVLRKEQD